MDRSFSALSSEELAEAVQADIANLIERLPQLEHGKWIQQVLEIIVRMIGREADRLDWKILNYALQDMEKGFQMFYPYRHVRKVAIFGSARIAPTLPTYQMAASFARSIAAQGFMVITGAGGGIMQAGNEGAGPESSFGLNIQLPFEQGANPVMHNDPKLLDFKYFFTRKLFFLRESDALALFPGGFGTQDEAFEALTLVQTGKANPLPLVLIDSPGGDYWQNWDRYIQDQLLAARLISPDDRSLYTITDDIDVACEAIANFYRVFHSCRFVGDKFVMRLKSPLPEDVVDYLNQEFSDILVKGKIESSTALAAEKGHETESLPRLVMYFNHRDFGRLYQMIRAINRLGVHYPESEHPEQK